MFAYFTGHRSEILAELSGCCLVAQPTTQEARQIFQLTGLADVGP